jgi:hypothetical protein
MRVIFLALILVLSPHLGLNSTVPVEDDIVEIGYDFPGASVLHRRSFFYVGGSYDPVGTEGAAISFGQMYVEHLVPEKVTARLPIVIIPGNGT